MPQERWAGEIIFGSGPSCVPDQGDIDGDGMVGFSDFLILSNNFGTASVEGDIDCSGDVGFADFLVLSNNFGNTFGAASVPEPTGVVMMMIGLLSVGAVRRRRSA